ncbi:hypothetical protein [Kitasatospora sp. NBC_00315]|uniref:hypothetical protein n=1 Tax=Kitasatospora sp. NBC_00315 TaxID=2975963 RepID=UPI00325200F2
MSRSLHRSLSALAAVGIAVAAPVALAGTAQAAVQGQHCDKVEVTYSTDGGKTFGDDGRMSSPYTKIVVKLSGHPAEGCKYNVSLASYNTQGPTWATSGTQTFLGWDTVTLSDSKPKATLDVSAHAPTCFGQIDLYGTDKKHDGVSSPLPKYPNAVFPKDLITAWNGGKACAPTPSTSPTATPTVTTSPTATVSPTASASPSASVSPSASPSASVSPSASPSASTSTTAAPSGSPSAPAPTSTAGPVGSPTVAPVSEVADASLATTGGNSTQTTAITVGGVALLALGGGAVFLTRRRAQRNS